MALFMPPANVVGTAVVYDDNIDDGNIDDVVMPAASDDEIPVPNDDVIPASDVGPVVRGCSNSAKIRLSYIFVSSATAYQIIFFVEIFIGNDNFENSYHDNYACHMCGIY